jgi:hypothetical protein
MELQLPERQAVRLANLSIRTGRSASELAVEPVDCLPAEESWFDVQVQVGIDRIARGGICDESAAAVPDGEIRLPEFGGG